jgi:hypothetical protein
MPEAPNWLTALADVVAGYITPVEPLAPLGCHYHQCEGVWEISLFVGDTELVGGDRDGERVAARFLVDVLPLLSLFDEVFDCTWQPDRFSDEDELGCHLSIIGMHLEQLVCVRLLSRSPDRFPPGRRANIYDGALEEMW